MRMRVRVCVRVQNQVKNLEWAFAVSDTLRFMLVKSAPFAVDSFFFMSGFLMAYLTFTELKRRQGRLNLVGFYLIRVVRVCPLYFAVRAQEAHAYAHAYAFPAQRLTPPIPWS